MQGNRPGEKRGWPLAAELLKRNGDAMVTYLLFAATEHPLQFASLNL
jgi:hypothetical protein